MDSKLTQGPGGHQGGYVLVAVVALTTVLLATGIAFMRWSTDEALQTRESVAAMQAYYLAQMGVVEEGFMWLRSQKETELPTGEVIRPGKTVTLGRDDRGEYTDVKVFGMPSINQGEFWLEDRRFRISAVGKVRIPVYHEGASDYKDIKRKAVLYVQIRNFADYMYLSNCELTRQGDRIKFWHGDTLQGRVHSNSEIAIMQDPQFYDQVTSTARDFWHGTGYNPGFHGPAPQFNVDTVKIPQMADELRQGAAMQGAFFTGAGNSYRVVLDGSTAHIYTWATGTPFDSTNHEQRPITGRMCMFFDGPLYLKSTTPGFRGQLTIGSSNFVYLIDNVYYEDASHSTGVTPYGSLNILGIVSEADVKVANTPANGREDSHGRGLSATNPDSTSIVITAAIVALGESFTFENQNDIDSGYVYQNPPGTPHRDDRGTIYVFGSITQMRRGYVHRSMPVGAAQPSTGYLKQYMYDRRFNRIKPPCFFHVTDEAGRALFNIVQWGQGADKREDITNWNLPRYN